jgi:Xaa-Pro aminopeptidase
VALPVRSFDLGRFAPPPYTTREEVEIKIGRLRSVLDRRKASALLLTREGAVRWLTGTRHQISDIAPNAESPVHALVLVGRDSVDLTFVTTRIEMPRVRDQLPPVFDGAPGVSISFRESLPGLSSSTLVPGAPGYDEALGEVVAPLVGGETGNQVRKLEWLYAMGTAVLTETAFHLTPGMNGARVRGMVLHNLAMHDIESNLVLVALSGQEKHFHPLYTAANRVEPGCWVKLVSGCRYAELIISLTVMAKIGRPSERESLVYRALQQGTLEYADLFRSGAAEAAIYDEVGRRFQRIEKATGLDGFQPSAYFHHMGGPTSPLGNRDYLLQASGTHVMAPWTQFAINPCDVIQYTKVELQGIVMPQGAPRMLDGSRFIPADLGLFTALSAEGGAKANVENLLEVPA